MAGGLHSGRLGYILDVMYGLKRNLNDTVAACFGIAIFCLMMVVFPAYAADDERLDRLFEQLQDADPREAARIEREIEMEFSNSGSPAMNLLLERGRDALEAGESSAAIEHLTALTDHAPEFAEGWYMRAMAFLKTERFGLALADLEKALALNPRHFEAIGALGFVMQQLDRPEMAQRAYTLALEIHPHHKGVSRALSRLDPHLGGRDL